MIFKNFAQALVGVPVILIALTFHEYAHGKTAYFFGDPTAKYQGRLTLNPLAHLDPIGTLLLFTSGFGWAKPVPVNPMNFIGDRKRAMMFVGLAGPLMNLVLAYLSAAGMRLVTAFGISGSLGGYLLVFFYLLLRINVGLGIFNLIPVPPLDGSRILGGLLPYKYLGILDSIERYGILILLFLVFTNVTDVLIGTPVQVLTQLFMKINGVSF